MGQISFSDAEYAGKRKKTRREVFLAGKTAVDPPPDEPKDSHAYFTVNFTVPSGSME